MSQLESQITSAKEKYFAAQQELLKLQQQRPKTILSKSYEFSSWRSAKPTNLSEFFDGKSELVVIHNMGQQCSYCTLWLDNFAGVFKHIASRASFIVASPDSPDEQKQFAISRDYPFEFISTAQSSFTKDMGYENETNGDLTPGYSVFTKAADGTITRTQHDEFGPLDPYCGIWHLFARLALQKNPWKPQKSYAGENLEGISGPTKFVLNYVKNFDESVSFYKKYFGFQAEFKMAETEVYGNIGGTGMWIGDSDSKNEGFQPRMTPMFNVKNARELHQRLKNDGVKVLHDQPIQMRSTQFWFQFIDNSGIVIDVLGN